MRDDRDFLEKVYQSENRVVAIDFDGVIHKNSKGFHDGTVYDEPLPGTKDALEHLSKNYEIIIFSCKALPDRPLIDGKTGEQLIWKWLEQYSLKQYIKMVTYKKPRACVYIDDKAYWFNNWSDLLDDKSLGINTV